MMLHLRKQEGFRGIKLFSGDSMSILKRSIAVLACVAAPLVAVAQTYPSKPVRIIVPYSAGGSTDVLARIVARSLSAKLGQPFTVENRAGAGGMIGHDAVAKAPGDGYTLLYTASGPTILTPHLYAKVPYDPLKSFTAVKINTMVPMVLVVNPKVKATTVRQLISEGQAHPGSLKNAIAGTGSSTHIVAELFRSTTKLDIIDVPYKGSAPALVDLVGGQTDMMFDVLSSALPLIKSGRLRALAVTSTARSPLLADVPTMQEAGVKDLVFRTWFGLLAPAGTNKEIVALLSRTLDAAATEPDFKAAIEAQAGEPTQLSSEQFDDLIRAEYAKWGTVIKQFGIKLD
jgi:tripartite-type tricarboxylate transporter receptor subunit TctC